MIEKLEKLSIKLFQQSLKTYTFKDATRHKRAKPNSLNEMVSMYPNKGVGFNIWKLGWPDHVRIKLHSAALKSNRFGKLRGIKYVRGQPRNRFPIVINGTSRRGIWRFSVNQAEPVQLDNGMIYTAADYQAFYNQRFAVRDKGVTNTQKQEDEGQQAQQGEQAIQQTQQIKEEQQSSAQKQS